MSPAPSSLQTLPTMITLYDCATAPSPRRARILLGEKGLQRWRAAMAERPSMSL